jgi:dUTP pyrophosphatase
VNKIDFKIKCCAQMIKINNTMNTDIVISSYKTGFYIYPRSSLSKTQLRLANNTGIIDAGYRGNLIGMFDVINNNNNNYLVEPYTRLLQICAPSLEPIFVQLVNNIDDLGSSTLRNEGGFGSTGR